MCGLGYDNLSYDYKKGKEACDIIPRLGEVILIPCD